MVKRRKVLTSVCGLIGLQKTRVILGRSANCEAWDEFKNPRENGPNKMAKEVHSNQHKFRGFPEYGGLSCILIDTAKEMAMCNDKLAP